MDPYDEVEMTFTGMAKQFDLSYEYPDRRDVISNYLSFSYEEPVTILKCTGSAVFSIKTIKTVDDKRIEDIDAKIKTLQEEKNSILKNKTKYWKYAGEYYRKSDGNHLERYSRLTDQWTRSITSFDVVERQGTEINRGDSPKG